MKMTRFAKPLTIVAEGFAFAAHGVTKLSVADGGTLTLDAYGSGNNTAETEITAEAGSTVVLNAADGGASRILSKLYLVGSGTVTLAAPDASYAAEAIAIEGGIAAATPADMTLHVGAASVTTFKVGMVAAETDISYPVVELENLTFANVSGEFHLTESVTVVRSVPSGYVIDDGARVAIFGSNPLGLGTSLTLSRYDLVVLDCTAGIPSGCTVTVNPGRTLAFKNCTMDDSGGWSYGWIWLGKNSSTANFPVVLNGRGSRVLCRNSSGKQLRLLANVTGVGEVLCRTDGGSARTFYKGMSYVARVDNPIAIPVNTVADLAAERADKDAWKRKVASWFDASDRNSFLYLDHEPPDGISNSYTNGYPILLGWFDKNKVHSDLWLLNRRILAFKNNDYVVQVMPYVVTNGLNGMDYVSMGGCGTTVSAPYCQGASASESRRLNFHSASTSVTGHARPTGGAATTATFPYCIMVFGSQQGGGKAILDDKEVSGKASLARHPTTIAAAWFAYDGFSINVDGYSQGDGKSATPNGGWQIVSLDMSESMPELYGLSGHYDGTYGGMNYAEVIFFSEVPTADERASCERYLAEKWGLTATYNNWDTSYVELSGRGQVDFWDTNIEGHEGATEIAVAGNYSGTLNTRAGQTLVLSERPAPPTAADIPRQDAVEGWYDPSLADVIDYWSGSTVAISNIYSRTATAIDKSAALMRSRGKSQRANVDSVSRLGASGVGPVINWMDFSKEKNSNLRTADIDWKTFKLNVRSVFMAIDSSLGGGNPFGADAYMYNPGSVIKCRCGYDISDPIWSPSNTVTMTHTWLDTYEVNGATTGFSGRAEVLGFELPDMLNTQAFLAYCLQKDPSGASGANYERIGETIIYNTTLTDAERETVQDYLMAKWLGDMRGKYTDLTGATVTGAGDVYSASLRNLPTFDSGFTGNLRGGANMSFTVDTAVNATAATDALTFSTPLLLDDACAVAVKMNNGAKAGSYTLLTVPSGTLFGKTFTLSLTDVSGKSRNGRLVASDTTLSLEVLSDGLVISFR